MKKSMIAAGAASVALAAMPIVGAFAAPTLSHTDTLMISIDSACSLGTVTNGVPDNGVDSTTHANGTNGTWGTNTTTSNPGDPDHPDTLSVNMAAGTTDAAIGTTTFTVRCNNANGYELQARSHTNDGTDGTLVSGTNIIKSGAGTGFAPATSDSYWNFFLSAPSTGVSIASGYTAAIAVPIADTTIATGTNGNVNAGQNVTVTYGAGINNTQPTGTYTGKVIYTLVPQP